MKSTTANFVWLRSMRTSIVLILTAVVHPWVSFGQTRSPTPIDPVALVRRATLHRMESSTIPRTVRYLFRQLDGRHDTTKDTIETVDGAVDRLVAVNGRPLSAPANQAELDRLHALMNHPEVQERHHEREQADLNRINRMMRLLPDALLFRFEGMAPCAGGQCYRLSFSPNPHFEPHDQEANIFRSMAGEAWIDQAQERLTRLEAHLVSGVRFGWGFIASLNKGGTVLIEQAEVGGHLWEVTRTKLNLTGTVLIFKPLNLQITEERSNFSVVPSHVDYRKAIQLLENSGQPVAPAEDESGPFGHKLDLKP